MRSEGTCALFDRISRIGRRLVVVQSVMTSPACLVGMSMHIPSVVESRSSLPVAVEDSGCQWRRAPPRPSTNEPPSRQISLRGVPRCLGRMEGSGSIQTTGRHVDEIYGVKRTPKANCSKRKLVEGGAGETRLGARVRSHGARRGPGRHGGGRDGTANRRKGGVRGHTTTSETRRHRGGR
eukprot:scaffold360_cov374-Pavlova_lutheri.AAC.4